MGQYYTTIIKIDTEIEDRIIKIDNDCFEHWHGLKLMEHSWLGSEWADLLALQLYNQTCRVAEVGDYADEFPLHSIAHREQFEKRIETATGLETLMKDGKWIGFDYNNKYLINLDKEVYIDFNSYIEKCKDKYEYVVSPMNLLTAQGNGRGGGDYHNCYPCFDLVGTWAWDLICIKDEKPEGFEEFEVVFKEEVEEDDDNV